MKIEFLQASNGDAILITVPIETGDVKHILIDTGPSQTYRVAKGSKGKPEQGPLKIRLDKIFKEGNRINLLILTHVDDDHINGALTWFNEDPSFCTYIDEVWFNSGRLIEQSLKLPPNAELDLQVQPVRSRKTSVDQGIELGEHLKNKGIWHEELIIQGDILERYNITFTILSPDRNCLERLLHLWRKKDPKLKTSKAGTDYKIPLSDLIGSDHFEEDDRVANGSSIGFVLTYGKSNYLFPGDAHPSVIEAGLMELKYTPKNKLTCELVKLSHHGSTKNTSSSLLQLLDCQNFIISTDGSRHEHPDKMTFARILRSRPDANFWFTYPNRIHLIFSEEDRSHFKAFQVHAITKEFSYP